MSDKILIPAAIRGRYSDDGGIMQHLELRPDECTNTLTSVQKDNVIVECRARQTTYDDYNRRIKSDQTCIGTVMPNFKNDAPGNGTKLIEVSPTQEDKITMLGGLQKHQTPRSDGICPCVNSAAGMGGGQTPIAMRPGFRVRKLTPKECWRLMGFDDGDFERARSAMNENIYNGNDRSSSQLYKQAGNSIVVDVLQHIMENLYDAMPYLFDDMTVGSFFSGIGAFEKALTRLDDKQSDDADGGISAELTQVGYINDYNGDANRVYDGNALARALKAEAGGRSKDRMVQGVTLCINSKVDGKQPSLSKRIYDPKGVSAAVTTSGFFMPTYLVENEHDRKDQN